MSDFEYKENEFLDTSFNDDVDDVDENDLELIKLVRSNSGLWDKSSKMYSNSIQKDLAWDSVGSLLPVPMTGSAAAKRFRTLRTIFGRHYKKMRESQPRSGAGSDWPVYNPTWPLYKELLFLTDVIKPRQAKSNMLKKPGNILSRSESSKHAFNIESQYIPSSICAKNRPMHVNPRDNTQLKEKTFTDNDLVDDPVDKNKFKRTYSSKLWNNNLYNIADNDNESTVSAGSSVSSGHPTKRQVPQTPPPDNFFTKKKSKHDSEMNKLDKLTGALVTISQQMMAPSSIQEEKAVNVDPEVDGILLIIKAALQRLTLQQRIPYLIEVLTVLQTYNTYD